MEFLKFIKNYLKGILLKTFPSLSYKGMVNTQIRLYKKIKHEYSQSSEDDILTLLLESRRRLLTQDPGAKEYYLDLMKMPNKTLREVVGAMVEWEYLDNMQSHVIRGNQQIPSSFIDKFRQEIREYIKIKTDKL